MLCKKLINLTRHHLPLKIKMDKLETRDCQNCKQGFVIEPDDFQFYEKMKVPAPTFCWLCRAQRRFAFRNERPLYRRTSSLSGKEVLGTYPRDAPFPVYTQEEWFSDAWDAMDYGKDYDFSKPFFQQYRELSDKIPRPARSVINSVNSDYSNNFSSLKNCYLVFNSSYSEDSAYGNGVDYSRDCFDNSHIHKSEQSYEGFWVMGSSKVFFSSQCTDCIEVYFSKNLKGCSNCFGCVNLRNKSYCIFNEQYTKEEYVEKLKEFNLGSYVAFLKAREEAQKFWLKFPYKYIEGLRNSDVSGAYISNSKNVKKSYLVNEGENLKYCQYMAVPSSKDCYDHTIWGESTSQTYECAMSGVGNMLRFCLQSYHSVKNLEYSQYCMYSSDLFGCIGLRNKQYCIFNKQYTKEKYFELVPKIIQHMNEMPYIDQMGRIYTYGEFFPIEFSPYSYGDTIAQEHFPLTKEAALESGYSFKDVERKSHTVTLPYQNIEDHIEAVREDITGKIIGCAHEGACDHGCTGAFKVIPQELQFLKRFSIALPRLCVNCRHQIRIKQRNSMKMYSAKCHCAGEMSAGSMYKNSADHFHGKWECPNEFETSYAPDRPEIVHCESCYQQEV